MGWFDVVASNIAAGCRGTTDIAFTVLDVLGYLDEIGMCYDIDGEITTEFPPTYLLEKAKPVIEKLPGWKCDIRGIKNYEGFCRKIVGSISNLWKRKLAIRSHWYPNGRDVMILFTDKEKSKSGCMRVFIQPLFNASFLNLSKI